jgi:hypothetical protein
MLASNPIPLHLLPAICPANEDNWEGEQSHSRPDVARGVRGRDFEAEAAEDLVGDCLWQRKRKVDEMQR